jgi:hypothetical protein
VTFISLLVVCIAGFASTDVSGRQAHPRGTIADLFWLAGNWKSDTSATSIEEKWASPAGGAMLAISRTISGGKMIAFEYLRIVERDGGLVYIAQPNGGPATEFVLSALSARSATFENPRHDFPKMIRYTLRPDGRLEAQVSDGRKKGESFLFTRD